MRAAREPRRTPHWLALAAAVVLIAGCTGSPSATQPGTHSGTPEIVDMPGSTTSRAPRNPDFERFVRQLNEQRQRRR